jgi:YD repeat-containing protein
MSVFDLVPNAVLYTKTKQVTDIFNDDKNSSQDIAFFKLSNILWLLQSVDEDANIDTGINIPSGIADVLTDANINLEEDNNDNFEAKLRIIANRAANLGLLSSGAIKPFGSALDGFYRVLGVNHRFMLPGTISNDTNGDGEPNSIHTYTYDADGNLLTESFDSDGDGEPNRIFTYTYDVDGNKLTFSFDSDGDGEPNNIYTYTYDVNGNKLTTTSDRDGDGEPNRITTYTYDADGNLLTYSVDSNADGEPNSITTYTYDTDGNKLTGSNDTDADGTADSIISYVNISATWVAVLFDLLDD